jgi:hypothetical protein
MFFETGLDLLDDITHTSFYCYQHNGMDNNEYNIYVSVVPKYCNSAMFA